jgi:6-phosphogluconate dehydrogenase (decarboxylating)
VQLGLVGLGRKGGNMRDRLLASGHEVVGYDPRPDVTDVDSLAALAGALAAPRVVWVMAPSGEYARFASQQESSPAMRAVAALRQQFGGHAVKKAAGPSGAAGDTAGPSTG